MKAEFIHTEHGTVIEITAFLAVEKTQLSEFMSARQKAHKGRLKLLKVTDKTSQLRIGMIQHINKRYIKASFVAIPVNNDYSHWRLLAKHHTDEIYAAINDNIDTVDSQYKAAIIRYNGIYSEVLAEHRFSTVGALEKFMIAYK